MSARDYERYHDRLPALQGRRSFATIKLHIDENKKNGTFLWLDPPWEFRRDNIVIESSASCPIHTEPDYDARFQKWCGQFNSIYESTIDKIAATPAGTLKIAFAGGDEILLPAEESEQADSWYDHWYYKESEKA